MYFLLECSWKFVYAVFESTVPCARWKFSERSQPGHNNNIPYICFLLSLPRWWVLDPNNGVLNIKELKREGHCLKSISIRGGRAFIKDAYPSMALLTIVFPICHSVSGTLSDCKMWATAFLSSSGRVSFTAKQRYLSRKEEAGTCTGKPYTHEQYNAQSN